MGTKKLVLEKSIIVYLEKTILKNYELDKTVAFQKQFLVYGNII